MIYYGIDYDASHLEHFGVKGMKWGVRKKEKTTNSPIITKNKKTLLAKSIGLLSPKIRDRQNKFGNYSIRRPDGKKVGSLQTHDEGNGVLNGVWLEVYKKNRGNKYATKALTQAMSDAKKNGFKYMTLEVPGNSPDARHIYEKLGFVAEDKPFTSVDDEWGGLTRMKAKI